MKHKPLYEKYTVGEMLKVLAYIMKTA